MDNILLVVDNLEAAIAFFGELGMELEGRAPVEGDVVDRLIGLEGVRAEIASMRTPDGHVRIELDKYHAPLATRAEPEDAPVNALGYRRIMFEVDDLDETLGRLQGRGARLIGEVVQYGQEYRLCYLRGPEGIMVALSQSLGSQSRRQDRD
jgi:catechol 2,3-dioxygenase-like lactoylglutathione lyase family enzyme